MPKRSLKIFKKRIDSLDGKIHSFISKNSHAIKDAEAIDARIAKGEDVGVMAGVPFGIKDMFCTKGLPTTAGSKILENFVPPYDATAVARLKKWALLLWGN